MLHPRIPDSELHFTFARSSGAGGQNVNKTSTKVILRWSIGRSRVFSWEEKERLRSKLATRLTNHDELIVAAEAERSQLQNREQAVARLQALVTAALRVPKKRRPTRPTRASKLRKVVSKKHRSLIKVARRIIGD